MKANSPPSIIATRTFKLMIASAMLATLHPLPSAIAQEEALPQVDRIDVTAEPFNADPTGQEDSTAAIQKAIDRAIQQQVEPETGLTRTQQVLYFPEGSYLVSDTLTLRADKGDDPRASQISFTGDGPGKSTIRLSDNSPNFQTGRVPVLVFLEGSRSNIAHQNEVMDLTIDVGTGNPGAVALEYVANNVGTIRRVVLKSSDPEGAGDTGLWLRPQLGGQALIHHLEVHGFKIGIDINHQVSAYTLEDILLENQSEAGLRNDRKAVAIHRLRSINHVPAIINNHAEGLVTVLSSELSGGDVQTPAIDNRAGSLVLQGVKIEGYGMAVDNRGEIVTTLPEGLWSSDAPVGLGTMPTEFLPVRDTPEVPAAGDADTFRVDTDYINSYIEANNGANEAGAIQAAIDSGKTDIVFERRRYELGDSLIIRGNVRRFDLNYGALSPTGGKMQRQGNPVLIIEDTVHPELLIERCAYNFSGGAHFYHIQNDRHKTLIIRDSMFAAGSHIYRNSGTGELFLENVFSIHRSNESEDQPGWIFANQNVWARQYNPERDTQNMQVIKTPHTVVDGGRLWVMGYKLGEYDGPYLQVTNGGVAELWGGFVNTIGGEVNEQRAMFVNHGGSMIVSGVERSTGTINHPIVLKHADGEQILHVDFPYRRGDGIIFPLIFSSFSQ